MIPLFILLLHLFPTPFLFFLLHLFPYAFPHPSSPLPICCSIYLTLFSYPSFLSFSFSLVSFLSTSMHVSTAKFPRRFCLLIALTHLLSWHFLSAYQASDTLAPPLTTHLPLPSLLYQPLPPAFPTIHSPLSISPSLLSLPTSPPQSSLYPSPSHFVPHLSLPPFFPLACHTSFFLSGHYSSANPYD